MGSGVSVGTFWGDAVHGDVWLGETLMHSCLDGNFFRGCRLYLHSGATFAFHPFSDLNLSSIAPVSSFVLVECAHVAFLAHTRCHCCLPPNFNPTVYSV